MKIWLFFGLMFMVGFASPAFASDKVALLTQKEILENGETAQRYMNGRNLAKYLENTRQPISVLREISGATEGRQLSNLVKDYVAYEDAIGGRDLRSVQYYNQYRDSSLVDEFEEFYGVNGANADNAGEPVTADLLADTLDQLLPSYLEQNPAVMARLKALQGDYKYDDDEVKGLVKSTGLDAKVVKELIKSMNSGRVASSAIIDVGTRVEEDAQEFVLKNFPNELAQAKQIRDRADGYFAAHDEAMVEYETFISNLSSAQFKRQFQEYAKYFRADQKDQAMQPYINQAQAILDRAEENQARGEQELQNLEQYIDRFERQKLEPAIKRHNRDVQRNSSLQTLPKFSASGVFAFASNAISITGGSSVGELATDSARDAFSSAVGGVEVPNSLEVDSVPTADVTKSLSGSFNSAQSGDPDDLFPLPTNAVTRYWRPSDNVRFGSNDWKPLCDDSKKASTGSSGKITRFSDEDCLDRYYRFTPNGGKVSQFFSLVKTADGNGSLSGGQIPLSVTNASKSSLRDVFRESSKKTNSFITNMKGASLVLTKRQLSAAQSLQNEGLKENGVDTRSAQLETKAVTGDGEEFERFNPVFSNDKDEAVNQAIQGGYCLVIEDKDGKYRKDGKKVSPVQIKDPSHPFSPRHKVEWLNYPDPLSTVCGGSGGNSSTSSSISKTCGTDRKNEIGGIYAWQIYGKSNAITKDYSYYKKPIIDNGGKILTNPKRLGIYTGVAYAAYAVCTAVTQGSAQKFCCDVAEHAGCQVGILPAVDPVNKLPLTYTKAHAQDDDDEKLPHLYDNAYDSYNVGVQTSLDKNNNGYNWMTSQPASNFGFNGPWVKSVVTGEVGFGEIEDMDKDDYAMYMLAIAGVNDGYSPGEDNNFSREAHNMSCGAGGWEELKRYQENCARQIGVNCICNYQKSFFEKSSWAYVLSRYSTKGLSIDNAEKSRIVKREVDGKMLSRSEDITERLNWDAKILMSRDGHPVNAQANYAVGGDEDEIYPGGDWVKGLSNAKKGSMIVMQQTAGKELTDPDATHGQFKRPWMAAYVEERNDTTGCITVSTMNNHSIFLDACGNSENAGVETKFEICPPGMTGKSTYKYPGGDIPSCASNSEYYTCQEDRAGWNAWIVKNPYAG